ncbi:MAG: hypothetical protein ABJL99_21745 [Aliishimia sp.]
MSYLVSLWWVWVCAALGLGLVELLAPGFIFLGFAIGALSMGALVGFGVSLTTSASFAVFAILSLIAWFVLRRIFESPTGSVKVITEDVNDN